MQVIKEEIRNKILLTARDEFLHNGFTKTSMRTIAKKLNITTSNIYNYFKNKDSILAEVLKPTTSEIMNALTALEDIIAAGKDDIWSMGFTKNQFRLMMLFVDKNRKALDLILFKSHGSRIQCFKDEVIEKYTELNMKHLEYLRKTRPGINANLSRFFMHNISSLYANIINEIIMHDITFKEMKKYSKEIVIFVHYGYKKLIEADEHDLETLG